MVTFSDSSLHGLETLTVADKGKKSAVTTLPVYPPAPGVHAQGNTLGGPTHPRKWYDLSKEELVSAGSSNSFTAESFFLKSSLHHEGPESDRSFLLIEQINIGDAKWSKSLGNYGESQFIEGYWEWLEYVLGRNKDVLDSAGIYHAVYASLFTYDSCASVIRSFCESWCPLTNTLHLPIGEMSISLWDLYEIGGLPVHGLFYDEVVPSAVELMNQDDTAGEILPSSCRHLLAAYHRIHCKQGSLPVALDAWVAFWFRGDIRYDKPPQRSYRKSAAQPRVTNNPSGMISSRRFLPQEQGVFDELGVEESERDEVFLAALLSCWLCKFALPAEPFNCIRPSSFKMASLMAHGRLFSLAVPVLASIYRGLSMISCSSTPSTCHALFPIHYVYGWLGQYFDSYWRARDALRGKSNALMVRLAGEKMAKRYDEISARKLFTNVDPSALQVLSLNYDKDVFFRDDGHQKAYRIDYMISLRSSYLTLRLANEFVVEAYSPHRFSRKFNFCQDLPGKLKEEVINGTLDTIMALWESSMRLFTQAEMVIPSRSAQNLASHRYVKWWSKYTRSSLGESTESGLKENNPKIKGKTMKRVPDITRNTMGPPKNALALDPQVKTLTKAAQPKVTSVVVKNPSNERHVPSDQESDSNSRDRNPKRIKTKHRSSPNIKEGEEVGEHLPDPQFPSTRNTKTTSVCSVEGPRSFDLLTKRDTSLESGELSTLPSGGNIKTISGRGTSRPHPCSLPSVAAEPSSFEMTRHMKECESAFIQTLWTGFARKLAKDPLHLLSRFLGDAGQLLNKIEQYDAPNFRPLQRLVDLFFTDIKSYDLIRSKNEAAPPGEILSESLEKVDHRLSEVEEKYAEKTKIFKDLEERLNNINSEIEKLTAEKKYVEEQMSLEGDQLSQLQNELLVIQEEKSSLSTAALLSKMEQTLESSRDELVKFQLY